MRRITRGAASAHHICEKIERVCKANIDAKAFRYEVIRLLQRAIPFDAWCWPLLDPDTLIPFEGLADSPFQTREQLRIFTLNYRAEGPASVLAPPHQPLFRLSTGTGGDFYQSHLLEEVYRPDGLEDELRVTLTAGDTCWSSLILFRALSTGHFTGDEEALMRRLIHPLATKLRQTLISPARMTIMSFTGPGVVILGPDLLPVTMTPLARRWLAQLWPNWLRDQRSLPPTVTALVARLEAIEQKYIPDCWVSGVRVPSLTGSWFAIQVERMVASSPPGTIALTLQPALPEHMLPLLLRTFALTRRERELIPLILQGLSTAEIAATFRISPYTVQEHLKAIFDKAGVQSRRELVALLRMS